MNKIYSKKILLEKLKEVGLPFSYPTLLRWEKIGLIKRPKAEIHYTDRSWRFYSISEINGIIKIIKKNYKK